MDNQLSNQKLFTRCVRYLSSFLLRLFHGVRTSTSILKRLLAALALVRVLREARAGLVAINLTLSSNKRIFLGVILLLVVAPLSGVLYQLFDDSVEDEKWFYLNYYQLFFQLGPYFCICLCLLGATLFLPQDSVRAYFFLPPLGFYIAKILWLCMVRSNEEFAQFLTIVPYYFLFTSFLVGWVLIFTFNWLTSLHFHKIEGTKARIIGIIDAPGITAEDKVRIAQDEIQKLRAFQANY